MLLSNFFSYIRGMGGQNDHPTPLDFKYRLRWYLLGKHSAAIFSQNKNTKDDNEPSLVNPINNNLSLKFNDDEICISESLLTNIIGNVKNKDEIFPYFIQNPSQVSEADLENYEMPPDYLEVLEKFEEFESEESIKYEGLKYIAGYIAHRFRNKHNLGLPTQVLPKVNEPDWLQFISKGNLMYPCNKLIQATIILEKEFNILHGCSLSNKNLYLKY